MKKTTKSPKQAIEAIHKVIEHNSSVNQRIKGDFVSREVKALFSYEMEAILKASQEGPSKDYPLPSYDDIENLYQETCNNCGEICPEVDHCQNCHKESTESEMQEIYEWWIVTKFLYKKLQARGEPVLEWGNNYYWGRGTSGQAILLDAVISNICEEMEILDGQKYSWATK